MLSVERPKIEYSTGKSSFWEQKICSSHNLGRSKEELAQLQARCYEFRHHPEPPQYARDEGYVLQELEWMQWKTTGPISAATSSGGMGTADTTVIERVEPSSTVAAMTAFLSISAVQNCCMSWRYPDIHTTFQCSGGGARARGERQFREKGSRKT